MDNDKIQVLRRRIRALTEELNDCIDELSLLTDGDIHNTGATEEDMGIHNQLSRLIDRKG
jgi:hypothetical protein